MKVQAVLLCILFAGLNTMEMGMIKTEESKTDKEKFIEFKEEYSKKYKSLSEENYRFDIFKKNLKIIEEHNMKNDKTFTLAINEFADLTFDEFSANYLNHMISRNYSLKNVQSDTGKLLEHGRLLEQDDTLPPAADWTKKNGAVAPVKHQYGCGSCWAFSAVSAVENALWRSNANISVELSEQELIDCSTPQGNDGCEGGNAIDAFKYIIQNGLDIGSNYKYQEEEYSDKKKWNKKKEVFECDTLRTERNPRYSIKEYELINPPNVKELQRAIYKGVTVVSFEVKQDFLYYSKGVYIPTEPGCGANIGHEMTAVGYNLGADIPYFKIRNSWGKEWGDEGYVHVAWGTGEGTCGLAHEDASTPTPNDDESTPTSNDDM
jgi:cathepsin L